MTEDVTGEPRSVENGQGGESAAQRSLGPEIRRLRDLLGMTLRQLSTLTGIREAYLAAIEDGREEPTAAALRRIAEHIRPAGTTYEELERLLREPEFDRSGEADRHRATPEPLAAAPTELQFERADFGHAESMPCAACHQPLSGCYFDVNGKTVCTTCAGQLRARLHAGSPWSRASRAAGAGFAAAAAGTVLYFAILAATGFQFALVAIVVGYMVGKAVNWGSYGRGGWRYQALAMALTYLSIVTSYLPLIAREMAAQSKSSLTTISAVDGPAQTAAATSERVRADQVQSPARSPDPVGPVGFLVAVAVLILFACAIPFLGGIQSILGIVIIGIGVYEAWKFNRRPPMIISGPHALGPSLQAQAGV